jgi:GTPase SAR1 family protein
VEFASKVVRVGTGSRRQRIKLQLWDTAGTERFRSVSRSYYRGAAGAILVYDMSNRKSFEALPTFLNDARALASPNLTVLLAGNKADVVDNESTASETHILDLPASEISRADSSTNGTPNDSNPPKTYGLGSQLSATTSATREVSLTESSRWASSNAIPVAVEVSAFNGTGVDELFARLARTILTKIELGEIDPDDPQSGIQYGDGGAWRGGEVDTRSVRSGGTTGTEDTVNAYGRRRRRPRTGGTMLGGIAGGDWEAVFRLDGSGRRKARGGCC